jgi:hypothetical protein
LIASKILYSELSGNPEIKSGIFIGICLLTNIRKIVSSYEFISFIRKDRYLFIDIFFAIPLTIKPFNSILWHRNRQICLIIKLSMSIENISTTCNDILAYIFSSRAVAQILDFFLDHKEFDYPISEIAKKTSLSFRTVFREVPNLERNHLIYKSRRVGKASMYRLNTNFEAVVLLERFALELSQLQSMKEKISTSPESDISESEISLSK